MHDFYVSNLGMDQCIRYFLEKKKQKYQIIKPKQSMHVKIGSNKANEWPLMSSLINKAKLKIAVGNESEVV